MLLDRADRDIYNAKWLISPSGNPSNDELLDDMAAYHVQQGIEKALKHALKTICCLDETYKGYRTHDIMALINIVQDHSDMKIPERLINAAIDITSWEARSRYNDSPLSVRKEISEAIDMYDELKQLILAELNKQSEQPDSSVKDTKN
ncbi:MAG: HEPN domain-containing protein [Lachnospiraceae bacterium]|nr:HEPN domain-containing protein [Lachnospiraceae bacterium]